MLKVGTRLRHQRLPSLGRRRRRRFVQHVTGVVEELRRLGSGRGGDRHDARLRGWVIVAEYDADDSGGSRRQRCHTALPPASPRPGETAPRRCRRRRRDRCPIDDRPRDGVDVLRPREQGDGHIASADRPLAPADCREHGGRCALVVPVRSGARAAERLLQTDPAPPHDALHASSAPSSCRSRPTARCCSTCTLPGARPRASAVSAVVSPTTTRRTITSR